jgi:hypothetical protein
MELAIDHLHAIPSRRARTNGEWYCVSHPKGPAMEHAGQSYLSLAGYSTSCEISLGIAR